MPQESRLPDPAAEPDPRRWVEEVAAGRSEGLAALFDRYAQRVFAIAVRVLRSEADAEEAVAEVFEQVWRDAALYDPRRGTVDAWIARLAHSRAIDRLRRRRARPDSDCALHPEDAERAYPEQLDIAQGLLESLQRESAVREALAGLGRMQRHCITLAFLEGLSHAEIAARLGMPLGTVKSHVRRGMLAMRAFLEKRGYGGCEP
ncbi:MAG: RNA polymerase sigma factor SigK [Lysobacteraceae bacterium]|nr:MAG: RNA polymerase sigma factor SigK [Xanthomonadaceae bacterium]